MTTNPWYDTTPTGLRVPKWKPARNITVKPMLHTRSQYKAMIVHNAVPNMKIYYVHQERQAPQWLMNFGTIADDCVLMDQETNQALREILTYLIEQGMRWGKLRRRKDFR